MCLVYDFQEAILDMAGEHLTTMMPGYTHYRHAQPTTLGHYLLSVFDPIARIMERTEDAYHSMSLNELGCGALAGTSWDIDRDLVSSYLGLTGLIENTNDAVGFTDGYLNVAACMANLMAIVSRFTLDLNVWSSEEFGFLEVPWVGSDESTSQSEGGRGKAHSYFMPNKTSNSPFLERARVGAAQVLGAMTEVASMGVRVAHGDMHEMLHMEDGTVKAIEYTHLFLHPLLFTLPRIQVFAERMNEAVSGGYSCATELANAIMRKSGLDYRTAHEVVYDFVLESKRRGLGAENPDVEIFQEAARSVVGKQLDFTADELRLELDPHHFMEVTRSQGGISPQETRRMLDERRTDIGQAHQRHEDRIVYLESSRAKMLSDLESAARG
jgi:argininosuccinate lyase